MFRAAFPVLIGILVSVVLVPGCTYVRTDSSLPDGQQDPIVGVWISRESSRSTVYRFWENGTFDAGSHSVDIHPRYIYQYKGEWKVRVSHEYVTEGPHIGYGDVTALAIWRDLTLVYEPTSDTFSIPVYQNQVFSRLSHDPDAPLDSPHAIMG
ncbi:MAG: hypothetical protein MUC66_08400 [Methanolinea sp.]|jgi:hypothetical protein|nr:hypothetical protein [Methanolinea sp.]